MTLDEIEPGIVFNTNKHTGYFVKLHPDQPYFHNPMKGWLITMPTNGCSNVHMETDIVVKVLREG